MVGHSGNIRAGGGFGTGLLHGVLLCGVALAALSLALPQPQRVTGTPVSTGVADAAGGPRAPDAARAPANPNVDTETPGSSAPAAPAEPAADSAAPSVAPDSARAPANPSGVTETPGSGTAVTSPEPAADSAAPAVADAPDAPPDAAKPPGRSADAPATPLSGETAVAPTADVAPPQGAPVRVEIPRGSEFARDGVDTGPLLPAPMDASKPRPGSMESPVVIPPVTEQAPAAATSSTARPQTRIEAPDPAAGIADPGEGADLPLAEAAIPVPPPGQVRTPGLDRLPEIGSPSIIPQIPPQPAPQTASPPTGSQPAAADPAGGSAPGQVPALDRLPEIGTPSVTPGGAETAPPVQASESAPVPTGAADRATASDTPAAPAAEAPAREEPVRENPSRPGRLPVPGLPLPATDLRQPPDLSDIRP
ncbi:hypothetical protein [Paracoccus pacificus]|uniref:Meckel syndrome type 1 protein n=1 Tax=Paracoccus pacificus TaxID=1463598 RepID=A0ABW4R3T8_9RHOB